MRAVDTNVLVRLATRDHAQQTTAAEAFIAPGGWVPHLVLVEAMWVLASVYELGPEKIATAGGLGSYVPVDNEDAGGNSAKNRRVTVFVLVSKASETDVKPASTSVTAPRATP